MCAIIKISNEDIQYAENILLGKTNLFDDERKKFIKNLETIDLQAVPGSGKTTALLAKLLILEKYMPFTDGSGVLVLSHTNAAVDEIKDRIGKYCPKLFSYPNFIGTIQSFVDTFLAIPFYMNQFKTKPYRIDNEIYDEQVEKFYVNTKNFTLKGYLSKQDNGLSFLKSIRLTMQEKLKRYINGSPDKFKLKDPTKDTYKALVKFKKDLLQKGYLHYDDAYLLANQYLMKYPYVKYFLQKRFKYVFVDEMQDMDMHQSELLEKIFYDDGKSESVYQRIGDKNQAIYNNNVKLDEIWQQRNIHYISGSHRLTPQIANLVEGLALTPNKITSLHGNKDNTSKNIKPFIIVFNDDTITQVIPKFAEIIKNFQDKNKIPKQPKHKFMAIGWIKGPRKDNKITISSYWKDYSITSYQKKIDYRVLKDYLFPLYGKKKTLEPIRKNILNAFLKVLRLENIKDENGKNYTKRKLFSYLKENKSNEYENFKLKIFQWSIGIIKEANDEVYNSIKNFIPEFLGYFDSKINFSSDFINLNSELRVKEIKIMNQLNKFKYGNIEIEIGTIHSAKGQTHTATLYLETFYQGKYESEYLTNAIFGKKFKPNKIYQKHATKMAYVGFSRPTHLLCVAMHKNRYKKYFKNIDQNIWKLVDISEIKPCLT